MDVTPRARQIGFRSYDKTFLMDSCAGKAEDICCLPTNQYFCRRGKNFEMLEISNLDEGKNDWINETQLIIPMDDNEEMQTKEIDVISKHALSLDGSDQTLLANATGQAFVIGLDRTLYENYNSKTDVLLMPGSDLKLLPPSTESKLTYNLAQLDQVKNEIIWGNNTFDKPITKDILNVMQETSKGWNEMGKNNELCLEEINAVNINENKINTDFFIESHLVNHGKKSRNDSNEYIVGYYQVGQTCDAVFVPASLMTVPSKSIDSIEIEKPAIIENDTSANSKNVSQAFVGETIRDSPTAKWIKSQLNLVQEADDNYMSEKINNNDRIPLLKMNNTHENSLILTQENIIKLDGTVIPLAESTDNDVIETKLKNDISYDDNFSKKIFDCGNGILSEQNLPLKKKAKMKKTPVNGSASFPSNDNFRMRNDLNAFQNDKELTEGCDKNGIPSRNNESHTDSDEPLSIQAKRRKCEGIRYNFKKKKKWNSPSKSKNGTVISCKGGKGKEENFPFKTVNHLLEHLKNEKLINDTIFKLLITGLEEMSVDVLKEMYSKRDGKCGDYSSHLKAFALMLHFKQPAAFNHLSEMFRSGWPPLATIKDWKRRLNNHRRPMSRNANP